MMQRLDTLRLEEVILPRSQSCGNTTKFGVIGFAGAFVLTVVTGGLAAPVAIPFAVGSWGCAFGGSVVGGALNTGEDQRWRRRKKAIHNLGDAFPVLRELYAPAEV